ASVSALRRRLSLFSFPTRRSSDLVNLAGAEFGAGNSASASLPGRYQIHYIYPGETDFKRYADLGMKLVRLPFRWERLQPKLNTRSEEHTSELQSRENLVCRLLLEK